MKKIFTPLFLLLFIFSDAQNNYALQFDGTDKYVSIPHNAALNFSNAFTVEAWIKTNASTRQIIAAKMVGGTNTWLFELQPSSGGGVKLNLFTHTNTGSDHLSNSVVPGNQWCHVAATYDGANVRLYINGIPDGAPAQTGTLATNTMELRIGAWGAPWGGGDERRFNGIIEEVRLWNVVRTALQIKQGMYGKIAASATGLIAYYKMNEGSGSATANSSSNISGLDGILVNAPPGNPVPCSSQVMPSLSTARMIWYPPGWVLTTFPPLRWKAGFSQEAQAIVLHSSDRTMPLNSDLAAPPL